MDPARHVSDEERRARLARRHAFAPAYRVADPVAATRAMTVLHATEPPTVYLSLAARIDGLAVSDIDKALYGERSLVKQLAMRRTLFVFPRDLLPAAWGSASARVAETERKKIGKDLMAAGVTRDSNAWLLEQREAVIGLLGGTTGLGAQEIRAAVPALDTRIDPAPGSKWGQLLPIGPRVLTWLGARAELVRGVNGGHWRTSRPRWQAMVDWLGEEVAASDEAAGYAELVGRWLRTFGPGTADDIVWWLGSTKTAVRRALADAAAVPVSLDGGGTGWMLPDDLEPESAVAPWAALLPVLDPTTMGWKGRDFYLDPEMRPYLFDTAGNGGTTAWLDGKIVGCWVQDDDARVQVITHADVPSVGRRMLEAEAARLTEWLDGVQISSVYKSRMMKGERLP